MNHHVNFPSRLPFATPTTSPRGPSIPAFTYLRSWETLRAEISEAMFRVIDSGRTILGPEVDAFEQEFASFVGSPIGVGVSSGTAALTLALRALKIGAGDHVLTTANGPVPTASAICATGAQPQFVDIDNVTLQLSVTDLYKYLTPQCKAIVVVHLYGHAAPIEEILAFARHHRLAVIEDCAQAHGTFVNQRHVGTFGDIGCFSFYPTKNLGAFGDAGMCVTASGQLAREIRELSNYGWRGGHRISFRDGENARLDEIQAAILRVRLRYLNHALTSRRKIASRYLTGLQGKSLGLPVSVAGVLPCWHQFVIRTTQREALTGFLANSGIQTGIHYQYPVHLMPAFASAGHDAPMLPITEQACSQVLSLPMFPELREDEVQRIVAACQEFCRLYDDESSCGAF